MQVVPLAAVPSQTITASLGGQTCQINVYGKTVGANVSPNAEQVYLDLYVENALIIAGVVCLNGVRIVRDAYLGFSGDLAMFDTLGDADPVYAGLGTRFVLVYYAASEL